MIFKSPVTERNSSHRLPHIGSFSRILQSYILGSYHMDFQKCVTWFNVFRVIRICVQTRRHAVCTRFHFD